MNAPLEVAALKPDRTTFVGGSDIGAIMGISPWKTPVALWLEKTGQSTEPPPDKFRQRILDRGKKLEPYVLEMVADKLREQGHEVEIVATNKYYTDAEHAFMRCEIDFELMLDCQHINGDCKTVSGFARAHWGEEDTDEVPMHYSAQFMYGLGITGRQRCLVAALIGLDDVAIYWVDRDDDTIAAMRDKAAKFWLQHVQARTPPDPIEFSDITALFPRDNGQPIEATPEIADAVAELKSVKSKIKALEEQEGELRFALGDFISPNTTLTFQGRDIATWKAQDTSRLDGKRLKADHPDIAAQYQTITTSRVLRLK